MTMQQVKAPDRDGKRGLSDMPNKSRKILNFKAFTFLTEMDFFNNHFFLFAFEFDKMTIVRNLYIHHLDSAVCENKVAFCHPAKI